MTTSRLAGWGRSLIEPRGRLLPSVGHRLEQHPRLAAATLVALRRLPGRRLRTLAYTNVSRPLARRMTAQLVLPVDEGRPDAQTNPRRVRALESVLERSHVSRLRLVKIDVEGYEGEVLRGLERLFDAGARPSVIVELRSAAGRAIEIIDRMGSTYGLGVDELLGSPRLDRFAPVPRPRPIHGVDEMASLCAARTANVLLKAPRMASQPMTSGVWP